MIELLHGKDGDNVLLGITTQESFSVLAGVLLLALLVLGILFYTKFPGSERVRLYRIYPILLGLYLVGTLAVAIMFVVLSAMVIA